MNYQNDDMMDIFLGTDHDRQILLHYPGKFQKTNVVVIVSEGNTSPWVSESLVSTPCSYDKHTVVKVVLYDTAKSPPTWTLPLLPSPPSQQAQQQLPHIFPTTFSLSDLSKNGTKQHI